MASTEEATAPKKQKLGSEYIETDRKKNIFSLFPREKFDKKFPFYRRPQEIGHFSLDIKREMLYDKSRLRYYTVTKNSNSDDVCFDLSLGFEKMIQKSDEQNELIDNILRWILQHRDVFAIQSKTSTSVTQTSSNEDHSSVTNSKQSSGTKRKHPSQNS